MVNYLNLSISGGQGDVDKELLCPQPLNNDHHDDDNDDDNDDDDDDDYDDDDDDDDDDDNDHDDNDDHDDHDHDEDDDDDAPPVKDRGHIAGVVVPLQAVLPRLPHHASAK